MGLGGGPREWEEYEWFSLADLPEPPPLVDIPAEPLASGLQQWLTDHPLWEQGGGRRLLLVDLDNLRADPRRWRARMAFVLMLARQADVVTLAGQVGAVRRARPYLGELAAQARPVADGSDLADHVLLEAADRLPPGRAQIVVLSNDGIFAALADRGRLTVVSPGAEALSDRLGSAAARLVDLAALEAQVQSGAAAAVVPAQRTAPKTPTKRAAAKKAATKKAAPKKAATKKAPTKKATTQKATTKKTATKKTATKKATTKKTPTKKAATPARTPVRKAAAKRSVPG